MEAWQRRRGRRGLGVYGHSGCEHAASFFLLALGQREWQGSCLRLQGQRGGTGGRELGRGEKRDRERGRKGSGVRALPLANGHGALLRHAHTYSERYGDASEPLDRARTARSSRSR